MDSLKWYLKCGRTFHGKFEMKNLKMEVLKRWSDNGMIVMSQ